MTHCWVRPITEGPRICGACGAIHPDDMAPPLFASAPSHISPKEGYRTEIGGQTQTLRRAGITPARRCGTEKPRSRNCGA